MKDPKAFTMPLLPEEGVSLMNLVHQIEMDLISQSLIAAKGNKAAAARLLGLERTTLLEKMRKTGMKLNPPTRIRKKAAGA